MTNHKMNEVTEKLIQKWPLASKSAPRSSIRTEFDWWTWFQGNEVHNVVNESQIAKCFRSKIRVIANGRSTGRRMLPWNEDEQVV